MIKYDYTEVKKYCPGFVAGIVRTAIIYPFDSLKVNMQKSQSGNSISNIMKIIRHNPMKFYRGSAISFIVNPFDKALQYSLLEKYKNQYNSYILGLGIGSLASLYTTPLQYITRNYVLADNKINLINMDTFKKMYSGFPLEFPKVTIGICLQMGTYTILREKIPREYQVMSAPFLGAVASMISWTGIFPLDTMMTERVSSSKQNKQKSLLTIFKQIYAIRGVRGFYFGITPVYARSVISSAGTMFAYEYVRKKLNNI